MHRSIKAFIYEGDNYYVAECHEIAVVTQGKTLDETIANLKEAVALHLEGEDRRFRPDPKSITPCDPRVGALGCHLN